MFWFYLSLIFFDSTEACAEDSAPTVRLSPIVIQETPQQKTVGLEEQWGDVQSVRRKRSFSTPSVASAQRGPETLGVPIAQSGGSTSYNSIRGFGKSSEETEILMAGVPLQPAQGGGMDLASFPVFLWDGSRFDPAGRGLNASGVGGSLALKLKTEQNLDRQKKGISRKFTPFVFSGMEPGFLSAAAGLTVPGLSVQAGGLSGEQRGVAGSLSARLDSDKQDLWRGRGHVVASAIEVDSKGSRFFPTPDAKFSSSRVLPVVQIGLVDSEKEQIYFNLYADWIKNHYWDSSYGVETRDQLQVQGGEGHWRWDQLELSFSVAQAWFRSVPKEEVREWKGALGLDYAWNLGRGWKWVPGLRVKSLEGAPTRPGVRSLVEWSDTEQTQSWQFEVGQDWRYASLLDRMYSFPGYRANPALSPEQVLYGVVGHHWNPSAQWSLQSWLRADRRIDAQVLDSETDATTGESFLSMQNRGGAWMGSWVQKTSFQPVTALTLSHSLTWLWSRLEEKGTELPYKPRLASQLWVDWKAPVKLLKEEPHLGLGVQSQTAQSYDLQGNAMPGWGLWELRVDQELFAGVVGSVRLWNVLDRPVEQLWGYPLKGRTVMVSLQGEF